MNQLKFLPYEECVNLSLTNVSDYGYFQDAVVADHKIVLPINNDKNLKFICYAFVDEKQEDKYKYEQDESLFMSRNDSKELSKSFPNMPYSWYVKDLTFKIFPTGAQPEDFFFMRSAFKIQKPIEFSQEEDSTVMTSYKDGIEEYDKSYTRKDFLSPEECKQIHDLFKRQSRYVYLAIDGQYYLAASLENYETVDGEMPFPEDYETLMEYCPAYVSANVPEEVKEILSHEENEQVEEVSGINRVDYLPLPVCQRIWTLHSGLKSGVGYYVSSKDKKKIAIMPLTFNIINNNTKKKDDYLFVTYAFKKSAYKMLDVPELSDKECEKKDRIIINSIVDSILNGEIHKEKVMDTNLDEIEEQLQTQVPETADNETNTSFDFEQIQDNSVKEGEMVNRGGGNIGELQIHFSANDINVDVEQEKREDEAMDILINGTTPPPVVDEVKQLTGLPDEQILKEIEAAIPVMTEEDKEEMANQMRQDNEQKEIEDNMLVAQRESQEINPTFTKDEEEKIHAHISERIIMTDKIDSSIKDLSLLNIIKVLFEDEESRLISLTLDEGVKCKILYNKVTKQYILQ